MNFFKRYLFTSLEEKGFLFRYIVMWAFFLAVKYIENILYITEILSSPIIVRYKIHSAIAVFSHTSIEIFIIAVMIYFISGSKHRGLKIVLSVIFFAFDIFATYIDIIVLKIYDFHINSYIISEMMQPNFFSTSGISINIIILGIIKFISALMILLIVIRFLFAFIKKSDSYLNNKKIFKRVLLLLFSVIVIEKAFLVANTLGRPPYIYDLSKKIPVFYLNSTIHLLPTLQKNFNIDDESEKFNSLNASSAKVDYPKKYAQGELRHKYNIILIVLESTRSEFATPETLPNVYREASKGIIKLNNYSGSNSTHMGLFSILYSIDPYFSPYIKTKKIPAFSFDILKKNNYESSFYVSSDPSWHKMEYYITPNFNKLEKYLDGDQAKRDMKMIEAMVAKINECGKNKKFVIGTLINSSHYPFFFPESDAKFKPYLDEPFDKTNYLFLNKIKGKLVNSYKNSLYFLDGQIEKIIKAVKKNKIEKETIIIVTSDHGCEFGEAGRYFYSSSLNKYQTRVPLIIIAPDQMLKTIDMSLPSSNQDIMPTLFDLMGYTGDKANFQGISLMKKTEDDYVVVAYQDIFTPKKYSVISRDKKIYVDLESGRFVQKVTDPEDNEMEAGYGNMADYLVKRIKYFQK